MCIIKKSREDAVSPVVGVMLMLVVTIIIAAVVSAFAGGLGKTEQKPPTASIECHITNDGTWGGSTFQMTVLSVSEAINTKDLKLVTSWSASDGTKNGTTVTGPSLGSGNTHTTGKSPYHSPLGFGPGVNASVMTSSSGPNSNFWPDQMFGNYSLMAGTRMSNSAYGYSAAYGGYGVATTTRWQYSDGTAYTYGPDMDGMQAILGLDWYHLRPGNIVNVKLIHIPTGKLVFDKSVAVEG
jgi:FlaG/FlaF family flagellin (archaellin)